MAHDAVKGVSSPLFDFLFVKPVPVIIWILVLLLSGLLGFSSMVKESLPDLEIPQAYVVTTWEGASPEMVEKEITQRIEKELKGMKGLKSYFSSSQHQTSIVAVNFHADMGVTEALLLLQRKVNAAQALFPKDAQKPRIEESSVRDMPIATFTLSGALSRGELERQARSLKERIEKIRGIKRVSLVGESREIVRVLLQPERIKALGLSPTLIREAVMSRNFDAPWGRFEDDRLGFRMKMKGAFRDLDALRNLTICRLPEGNVIRLKDVAQVSKGFMRETTRASLSWHGGEFSSVVAMNLYKSSGQDTIELVEKARKEAVQYTEGGLRHKGLKWRITGDESRVIRDELKRGLGNGWQAMLAVFLVLMVMLTWREALVAALLVPLTFLGAMAVLWAMGYSFNLLIIVGMIFALGLLVDDFILIMEGMHEGVFVHKLGFIPAVKRTVKTYAVPSLTGSLTTILVLLPLVFLGGVDGKFIRLIPITAVVCLALSYIISIVLGPPLTRFVLALKNGAHGPNRMDRISKKAGAFLSNWLKKRVVSSRKRAVAWVVLGGFLFLLSLGAAANMRNTLYPKEDGRGLGITVELIPDARLDHAEQVAVRIGDILKEKPYLEYVLKVVGEKDTYSMGSFHDMLSPTRSENFIGFSCFFSPRNQRQYLAHEYVEPLRAEIERALADEPGVRLIMNPQIGGPSSEDPLQIDIQGEDIHMLKDLSIEVQKALSRIPGVVDIRDNVGPSGTDLDFRPLPEALDFHRVSQQELAGQMIAFMENEKIGKFRMPGTRDDLDIRLSTWWPSRNGKMGGPKDWEELERITIINADDRPVPLWNLVEPIMDETPAVIKHKDGRRSITVRAKLHGIYVSEIIERMRPVMDGLSASWPPGYAYAFAGEEEVEETYEKMGKMFILAMLLVFAILALLFDSLVQPVIILFTVLFALIGVFIGFFLADIPFSFSAAIGVVALVGIVVNDSIIVVDTMNAHRKKGGSTYEAAGEGASDRLRPIVSTTLTNLAGLLPLALSDPAWSPLCMAIIFGEIAATMGALIFTPAMYVALTPQR
ncbi:MAG: efflux RND transporter permease subunit [Deltaproteobacteria bacterium]|nr:efflux RND transporter permease subunit [Deltaproteobacteria bacterium]